MKIVAGLGAVDDYIRLVEAGADEVFCGYVPYKWNRLYGSLFPLNRREVLYYNVQIGSLEEMKILKKMVDTYKVPVSIAFNYLYYLEEQYKLIEDIMLDLINIGFNDFIIADISLLVYLKERGIKASIHLSGEAAEINSLSIKFFNNFNISRYIFHRKNTIEDMEECIKNNKEKNIQYEAFILNEKCHYTGAFCNSLHCDEMIHLCQMIYDLSKIDKNSNGIKAVEESIEKHNKELEEELSKEEIKEYNVGATGCGLCFLKRLKKVGVTHLKVVGRGNSIDNMERDIRILKRALELVDSLKDNKEYEAVIKKDILNNKCNHNCYY